VRLVSRPVREEIEKKNKEDTKKGRAARDEKRSEEAELLSLRVHGCELAGSGEERGQEVAVFVDVLFSLVHVLRYILWVLRGTVRVESRRRRRAPGSVVR